MQCTTRSPAQSKTIREVMAFPKNNKGTDLMTDSPAQVDPKQLRDLRIKTVAKKEEKGKE